MVKRRMVRPRGEPTVSVTVRMAATLKEALVRQAADENRSLANLVVTYLKVCVEKKGVIAERDRKKKKT